MESGAGAVGDLEASTGVVPKVVGAPEVVADEGVASV